MVEIFLIYLIIRYLKQEKPFLVFLDEFNFMDFFKFILRYSWVFFTISILFLSFVHYIKYANDKLFLEECISVIREYKSIMQVDGYLLQRVDFTLFNLMLEYQNNKINHFRLFLEQVCIAQVFIGIICIYMEGVIAYVEEELGDINDEDSDDD